MEEIKDMLGRVIDIGDILILPAGSQRYGGLRLDIGIVTDRTEKRIKVLLTKMVTDKKRTYKSTATTGKKFLLLNSTILENPVVEELVHEAKLDYTEIFERLVGLEME